MSAALSPGAHGCWCRMRAPHLNRPPGLPLHPPQSLLPVLCAAAEYAELPVRHNEDKLNVVLSQQVRWPTDSRTAGRRLRLLGRPAGTSLAVWCLAAPQRHSCSYPRYDALLADTLCD